jgi:hypothetical protein
MCRMTKKNRAKRPLLVLAIVLSAVTLMATSALALASGLPDHDAFVMPDDPETPADESATPHNGQNLDAAASQGGIGACEPTETIYLKWDLSELAGANVDTATLTLTATYASDTGSADLTLYQTSDGWSEDALTLNTAPSISASIQTVSAPPAGASPTIITFSNPALVTYINDQAANDGVASFALRFSNCSTGFTFARFADKESAGDGPYLLMQNNNAVRLHTLRTAGKESKWLVVGGLVFIVLGSALVVQPISRRQAKSESSNQAQAAAMNRARLQEAEQMRAEHGAHSQDER